MWKQIPDGWVLGVGSCGLECEMKFGGRTVSTEHVTVNTQHPTVN